MAASFSLDAVKEYILQSGGRIRNHELVTHFKSFLNHPVDKAVNREKFKDFVNELATIKVEEGEKVLVLKKKHRPDSASFSSSGPSSVTSAELTSSGDGSQSQTRNLQALRAQFEEESSRIVQKQSERLPVGDNTRAQSEPRDTVPAKEDVLDGGHMSKVYSDDSLEVKLKSTTRNTGLKPGYNASSASLASTGSQGSLSSMPASTGESVSGSGEDEANVSVQSVKERALHLNKMTSEAELQQARAPQRKKVAQRDDDEESHTSGGSFVTLSAEEKEWMVVCTNADYHEMHKLLSRKPNLAKVKNLSNGYTALHWAAKAGKPEVIKLLANKIGVNVNQRSYGGYTPLHLAAIHGHEDVLDLLVNTYKADVNIRDYSGKKPKQYLKNSASSRAQRKFISYCGSSGDLIIAPSQPASAPRTRTSAIVHLSMTESQVSSAAAQV